MISTPSLNRTETKANLLVKSCVAILLTVSASTVSAQSVTEVITDYNGFWKSSATAINSVKPDNHNNLLSFNYNGTRYSTGVNDALLTANGQTFNPNQFRALPLQNLNSAATANTKIGLGAMIDGVANGAGAAPSRSLGQYLNDGVNGLDMGTCIANLPAGSMFMSVSNLQSANVGDGVPDILVTQTADPSSSHDYYEFTDINGVRVGNSLDVNLDHISPVGNWMADFYEATGSQILTPGYTQTQRAIRLWAADFSSFGINASNISSIAYFKITLSGSSDIAFVAYNTSTITVQQVLDLPSAIANRERIQRATPAAAVTSISLYPNPANGMVNFSHPSAKGTEKILVYNVNGILLMQQSATRNTSVTKLNISSFPAGAYQVVYTNGLEKSTGKLIIK